MNRLVIFRNLLNDKRIKLLTELAATSDDKLFEQKYYELCSLVIKNEDIPFPDQITALVLSDENAFSIAAEKGEDISNLLEKAVLNDIDILREILSLDFKALSDRAGDSRLLLCSGTYSETTNALITRTNEEILEMLYESYNRDGCGVYRLYDAFTINEDLEPVPVLPCKPMELGFLYGYEGQKADITGNTERLVSGLPAHNILLFGDSGTGKSTMVKAMLPLFRTRRLRLVEVDKDKLHALPSLIASLSARGLFFIVFIDDLSFEHNDEEYKFLKTIIQGGLYENMTNVRFYVTSNRRNIVKQNMQARENEVNVNDFLNETVSLTDRFGLKIYFDKPTKVEFLEIVRFLAELSDISFSEETEKAALKFAFFNGGYNGRSARQFIDSIITTPR